jgi:hypothetical protein
MQMPIVSVGYTPKKADSRCRAWCQILSRAAVSSLRVAVVSGADSLGGRYETFGREIEVFAGDFIFEGEANHHTKNRGWSYSLGIVVASDRPDGDAEIVWVTAAEAMDAKEHLRVLAKRGDFPAEDLKGAGEVAALVRYAQAVLAGHIIPSQYTAMPARLRAFPGEGEKGKPACSTCGGKGHVQGEGAARICEAC